MAKQRPAVRIQVVEAPRCAARQSWLASQVEAAISNGGKAWSISCDFDRGGPWAGVNDFLATQMGQIMSQLPALAEHHAFELTHVLPALRKKIKLPYSSLTDRAAADERVRNYAADRAFRLAHGLIDLLDSWKTATSPDTSWHIFCDDFDRAGSIGGHFLRELMRRRGESLDIWLTAVVEPGQGIKTCQLFDSSTPIELESLNLSNHSPGLESTTKAGADSVTRWASELERQASIDEDTAEIHLNDLIHLWTLADRPDKVLHWKSFAVSYYLHQGLYEDATRYSEGLLSMADKHKSGDEQQRLWLLIKTLSGYMGGPDIAEGMRILEAEVMPSLQNPIYKEHVDLFFLAAMMYARFNKPRDLGKGEELLDRGIAAIETLDLTPEQYHFNYVFNRNGVAMIRSFQGRLQEAIDLCRAGIERLNCYLGSERHRLHRSVLVYNIAQVYFALGANDEAIDHYTTVIKLDPDYSEYYNERGNLFLRVGRLEEARADYLEAIRLSPPYFEVHTNLGQCYRRMGRYQEAIAEYTRALDLRPDQTLAIAGRAKAQEELGKRDEAIADYSAALELDPGQWELLASRGVLHYEAGNLVSCLADFDRALALAPDQSDLRQNRAIVLADLERQDSLVGAV